MFACCALRPYPIINGVMNMKKIVIVIIAAALIMSLSACKPPEDSHVTVTTLPSFMPTEEPSLIPTEEASPTLEPTIEPTETPTDAGFSAGTPDHAGSGDTLFDIYESMALADLDGDGTDEEIEFQAGDSKSTLYIDGAASTIDISGLAQLFAVTDVDKGDKYLELVFTDEYDSDLGDTEFPYSYVYWYDGSTLASMGSLMDVKFAGAWRSDFKAKTYFKADGYAYGLAHATELTDIWYLKRLKPNGSDRKFKEDYTNFAPVPVNTPGQLTIKAGKKCLLLAHGDSSFFGNSDMWNYAKYPHNAGRVKKPNEDIVVIAQAGETMKVVAVLGQNWVKLQSTLDGSKGWIKISKGKVLGYNIAPADLFDGIVIAG